MKSLNKVNVVNDKFDLTVIASSIAKAHSTKDKSLEALNTHHKEWYLKDNADIQDIYSAFSKAYFATRNEHGVGTYERVPSDQKGKEKLVYKTPKEAKEIKNKARLVTFTVADILDCVPKEAKKICVTKGTHQGYQQDVKHDQWFSKIFTKLSKKRRKPSTLAKLSRKPSAWLIAPMLKSLSVRQSEAKKKFLKIR